MTKNKTVLSNEDLQNLYVGQVFNSKKELFDCLGLACSSGNTRKAAEKTINQYLRLVSIGKRKIQIDEIYDSVQKRADKRSERPLELEQEFHIILTQFFRVQKRQYYTINQLATLLNCYSLAISSLMKQSDDTIASAEFSPFVFELFYRHTRKKCKRLLIPRLRRLDSQGMIIFQEGIMVDKQFYDDSTTEYDTFIRLREQCAKELGYTSLPQAMFGLKRRVAFFDSFKKLLRENDLPEAYICFHLENISFGIPYT